MTSLMKRSKSMKTSSMTRRSSSVNFQLKSKNWTEWLKTEPLLFNHLSLIFKTLITLESKMKKTQSSNCTQISNQNVWFTSQIQLTRLMSWWQMLLTTVSSLFLPRDLQMVLTCLARRKLLRRWWTTSLSSRLAAASCLLTSSWRTTLTLRWWRQWWAIHLTTRSCANRWRGPAEQVQSDYQWSQAQRVGRVQSGSECENCFIFIT